jgi:hypothetical protein
VYGLQPTKPGVGFETWGVSPGYVVQALQAKESVETTDLHWETVETTLLHPVQQWSSTASPVFTLQAHRSPLLPSNQPVAPRTPFGE